MDFARHEIHAMTPPIGLLAPAGFYNVRLPVIGDYGQSMGALPDEE
jgi:hypothetical protein